MKIKVMMLALLLALASSACVGANQPPVAYLDSISPSSLQVGDVVLLAGHGVDQDGQVVSYTWRSSIDGVLGNSSSINISSLSAGEHTVYFKVCDDDGACSQEVTAKLAVTGGPVTAEVAAEMVVDEVIQPMNFEGPIIGFKLEEPLEPGDTVGAYGSQGQQVDEECYFFFIDLHPRAYYAHDVLFVLVDTEDGALNVSEEEWWPLINGEPPAWVTDEEDFWDEGNWIHSQEVSRPVAPQVSPPQFAPQPQQQWWEAAVVVNGHAEGEALGWDMAMNAWRMWVMFDSFLDSDDLYEITPPPIGSNTPTDLFNLLDGLCDEGYDHITVYIFGHGNIDLIKLGDICMYASDVVDFLNAHPETSFSFLLESCHSGSFIDDLSEVPNVYLVLTATSTLFAAMGDVDNELDPNPDVDSGGEWGSSMYFSTLEQLSYDNWANICAEANSLSTPPSVVLLLSAFSNAGTSDELGLDAAYLSGMQFPQAWSPWTPFCDLWEYPPQGGEALLAISRDDSGSVTSSGSVSDSYGYWFLGGDDSKRAFLSFPFPEDMPVGSTVRFANIKIRFGLPYSVDYGYLGDIVIEHLNYGVLGASDFSAPATEVATVPIWFLPEGGSMGGYISVKALYQQDFNDDYNYSQYRLRFTGETQLSVRIPTMLVYYEVR